ncbi:MAG: YqaJ viral recombinase family protein, partial [Dehalococcoidia bacterium]|nr:YqaJ viral recombinase family protein [Dehalococcoidia bacterium]
MDDAAWLAARRAGIGGTDAAAILGLSPFRTPLDVYLDKTGAAQDERTETQPMRWGKALEPVIAEAVEERIGRHVRMPTLRL